MNLSIRVFGKVLALVLIIIFFSFIYFINSLYNIVKEEQVTKTMKYKMIMKSDELRRSSNYLTRFARNYVVTTEIQYKKDYYKVLNIRKGKDFKPKGYNRVYWNLAQPYRSKIHPDSKIKSALIDEIKALPYTKEQLHLLESSLSKSQELVKLELKAFKMMELNNQNLAIEILFSNKYKIAKHNIMIPLNELLELTYTDFRIYKEKTQEKMNNLFKLIFILVISGISIFFIALFSLRKKVLIPIEYLMGVINKIKHDEKDLEKIIYCNDEIGVFTEQLFEMKEQRDKDFEKLKQLSITDSLTGIKNRRSFFESSEKFFKLAKRKELELSVIMLDIDFFKKVNDTYGHLVGDEILKFLVKIVNLQLRDSDIFARYGGEEFIILLPDTNINGAYETANKLRKLIEKSPYTGDENIFITISLGIAQLQNEKILNELIKKADEALYKAKDSGRNIAIKAS